MREEIGIEGCGGDRGQHHKHLETHRKRQIRMSNEVSRIGDGKWKAGSESVGGGQTAVPVMDRWKNCPGGG